MSSNLSVYKRWWDMHVQGVNDPFPRAGGPETYKDREYFRQTFSSNADYYGYLLMRIAQKKTAYVGTYSDKEVETHIIDRMFFETDNDALLEGNPNITSKQALEIEWERIQDFVRIYWDYLTLYYSGNRGFHIHLKTLPFDVSPLDERLHPTEYAEYIEWLDCWIGEDILDVRTTASDIRRLCRVPLTYHEKTGHMMIPVHWSMTVDEILENAKNPTPEYLNSMYRVPQRFDFSKIECACSILSNLR